MTAVFAVYDMHGNLECICGNEKRAEKEKPEHGRIRAWRLLK